MLDTTSRNSPSSASSADPDALALLARSLWEFGNGTQQQTNRLFSNRQTAAHGPALANLAKRFTASGEATATVSRDFAHADQRAVLLLLGINQTARATRNAPRVKSFAMRSPKRTVVARKVGAAVVSSKTTVTRAKRVAPKPIRKAARSGAVPVLRGRSPDLSRIISTLEVRVILRLAASQVGVKEQRTNRTKYGRWYGMNGQAWCAMFVSWVGAHAGVSMPKINSNKGFSAVVSARSFARKNNLLTTKPRVGSVFLIIGRNGKGHTGLVESINWARRTITTIEGNTNAGGSRNGDGVYRRTRRIATINGGFMLIPTKRRTTKR
jgi:CHAP domain